MEQTETELLNYGANVGGGGLVVIRLLERPVTPTNAAKVRPYPSTLFYADVHLRVDLPPRRPTSSPRTPPITEKVAGPWQPYSSTLNPRPRLPPAAYPDWSPHRRQVPAHLPPRRTPSASACRGRREIVWRGLNRVSHTADDDWERRLAVYPLCRA